MNNKILDLAELARRFSGPAAIEAKRYGKKIDEPAIEAMKHKAELSIDDRTKRLVRFWYDMSVARTLRGVPGGSTAVANEIILKFAETLGPDRKLADAQSVLEKFGVLYDRCISVCNANGKFTRNDGTVRDLTSLTSKTLWCCYPSYIPIFDTYAHRALQMLSRLLDMRPPGNGKQSQQHLSEYQQFIEVWFDLYTQVKSDVETAARSLDYEYPARIFDKMLWIIGNEQYGKWS